MIGLVKVKMLKGEKGDMGATGDYSGIANKPSINGVTLNGNKTASALGLASASEQQNLIDSVAALGSSVSTAQDDILAINGDIGTINDSLTAISGDISALSAKDAFIVRADYDPVTHAMTNPDKTTAQIYAAVKTNGRPCYLFGSYNNNVYIARCVYSASSAAWFNMCALGDTHSWIYSGSSFIYSDGKVVGTFTPSSGVTLLEGSVAQKNGYVYVNLFIDGTFSSGNTTVGVISGVDIPSIGAGAVVAVGTGTNLVKTGLCTIDSVGNVTIKTEVATYTRASISFVYQK